MKDAQRVLKYMVGKPDAILNCRVQKTRCQHTRQIRVRLVQIIWSRFNLDSMFPVKQVKIKIQMSSELRDDRK